AQHGAVGVNPVADRHPLLAVPLLEAHRAATLVIRARQLDRLQQTERAELFQAMVVDREILEAPADLLAGERALAKLGLRGSNRLDVEDPVLDAQVVIDRAETLRVLEVPL